MMTARDYKVFMYTILLMHIYVNVVLFDFDCRKTNDYVCIAIFSQFWPGFGRICIFKSRPNPAPLIFLEIEGPYMPSGVC